MEHLNHPALSGDLPFPKLEQEHLGAHASDSEGCGCGNACRTKGHCLQGWGLGGHPLAMVYAPCQSFESLYDLDTALLRGTLFAELDLPLEVVEGKGKKNTQPSPSGCVHKCHV